MKNQNISYRKTIPALLLALGLGCLALPRTAQAGDPSIVGLWRVHYFSGTVEIFQSFEQWHSDGLEFEVAALGPGAVCQGTFKQTASGTIQLFHVGWNFDQNGALTGFFKETQINTVGPNGERYSGMWDIKNYDTNGNFLNEDTGTLKATRLSVH
jgi:hypothetical protein